jgi:hypothetical protein
VSVCRSVRKSVGCCFSSIGRSFDSLFLTKRWAEFTRTSNMRAMLVWTA